jgi:hypothetical protein
VNTGEVAERHQSVDDPPSPRLRRDKPAAISRRPLRACSFNTSGFSRTRTRTTTRTKVKAGKRLIPGYSGSAFAEAMARQAGKECLSANFHELRWELNNEGAKTPVDDRQQNPDESNLFQPIGRKRSVFSRIRLRQGYGAMSRRQSVAGRCGHAPSIGLVFRGRGRGRERGRR